MKKNKKKRTISDILKTGIIVIICVMCIGPLIVNGVMFAPIITAPDLENKEWLGFWGSYLGGCIGGICSLITIYVTIKYYDRQEAEHKKELEDQLLKHEKEIREEVIRKYRPLLILHPCGGSGLEEKYNPFFVNIQNVSEYAAIDIVVENIYKQILKRDSKEILSIKSSKTEGGYNDYLSVSAKDVLGNEYTWKYQLITVNEVNSSEEKEKKYSYKIIEEDCKKFGR